MKVTKNRFEDAAEPDENGEYDYFYSGVIYDYFDEVNGGYVVRCYDDTPLDAAFQSVYELIGDARTYKRIAKIPYRDAFFCAVVRHLAESEGKESISVLTKSAGQYESVSFEKLGS
jgi:hypothetical protein